MATPVRLTPSDEELLGQMARFAERTAGGTVFYHRGYSRSLAAPVVTLIGIGEQALQLDQLIMAHRTPESSIINPNEENGNGF